MDNSPLNVNPQQSPHTTPSHGANISSTVPVTSSTVVAVTQSNVNFGNPLVQNPWSFDSSNLRNQKYIMPSSFMMASIIVHMLF